MEHVYSQDLTNVGGLPPIRDLKLYTGAFLNEHMKERVAIELDGDQLLFTEYPSAATFRIILYEGFNEHDQQTQFPAMAYLAPHNPHRVHVNAPGTSRTRVLGSHTKGEDVFVGFWASQGRITDFCWGKGKDPPAVHPGEKVFMPAELRYSRRVSLAHFFTLPLELRTMVYKNVLMAPKGRLRLVQSGKTAFIVTARPTARSTKGKQGPKAAMREPKHLNILQPVCKQLKAETTGLELQFNRLESHGLDFHNVQEHVSRLSPKLVEKRFDWLKYINKLTLSGDLKLDMCPDEKVLRGIIQFARHHPNVKIRVNLEQLTLAGHNLQAFITFAFQVEEAIRFVARPTFVAPGSKVVASWRRGRGQDFLDNKRVLFFPSDHYSEQRVGHLVNAKGSTYTRELLRYYQSREAFKARIAAIYHYGI